MFKDECPQCGADIVDENDRRIIDYWGFCGVCLVEYEAEQSQFDFEVEELHYDG